MRKYVRWSLIRTNHHANEYVTVISDENPTTRLRSEGGR